MKNLFNRRRKKTEASEELLTKSKDKTAIILDIDKNIEKERNILKQKVTKLNKNSEHLQIGLAKRQTKMSNECYAHY